MSAPIDSTSFFITGTDTGVGKTFVAAALLMALRERGLRVAGYKPVAAGADLQANGSLANDDALALQAVGSAGIALSDINPVCLPEACAPHIAAQKAGVSIDIEQLVSGFRGLQKQCDAVVVEGAGGLLVPLGPDTDFAMLAQRLALPVILVVGMRLGCINHALLTVEALATRGIKLAAWVANGIDPAFLHASENLATLQARIPAPLLGILPHLPSPAAAAPLLDLGKVMTGASAKIS